MNTGNMKNSAERRPKYSLKNVGGKCLDVVENMVNEGEECIEGGIKELGEGVESIGKAATSSIDSIAGGFDNLIKFKRGCENFYALASKFKGYIEDDSIIESTLALTVWLAVCYFFQIWMIPVGILLIYVKNLIFTYLFGIPEEKKPSVGQSVKDQMEAVKDILSFSQDVVCNLELLLKQIFGFLSFQSLHLSWVLILIQVVITFVLMYIPINYLLMLWGISLYSKKFLKHYTASGKSPEENTENIVEATEELQSVSGSFLSLNITKGFRQLDNVYGKLFSKRD